MINVYWVDAHGVGVEVADISESTQMCEIWEQLYAEKLGIA